MSKSWIFSSSSKHPGEVAWIGNGLHWIAYMWNQGWTKEIGQYHHDSLSSPLSSVLLCSNFFISCMKCSWQLHTYLIPAVDSPKRVILSSIFLWFVQSSDKACNPSLQQLLYSGDGPCGWLGPGSHTSTPKQCGLKYRGDIIPEKHIRLL